MFFSPLLPFFQAKKILPPRGNRWAALSHPRWVLHGGHTLVTLTWNWLPRHSDREGVWLKHQEDSEGLGSALVLLGESTGLPLMAQIPLPGGTGGPSCQLVSVSGRWALPLLLFSPLPPSCLSGLTPGGPILGVTLAFTEAGAHPPQAMLGDNANGGSPSGCSSLSHCMIHSG